MHFFGLMAFLKKSLHGILSFGIMVKQCPGGEIGRRSGLKIHRSLLHAGSSPAIGTKPNNKGSIIFGVGDSHTSFIWNKK